MGRFLLAFDVDFQEERLGRRTESTVFPWSPFRTPCCSCTASLCHTSRLALLRVRFGSTCIRSERALSLIPTTILSLISSSFSAPNSHDSAKLYKLVINCSIDSLSPWHLRLNQAHSKIMFFRTLKNLSNFSMTLAYTLRSTSVIVVEVSVSSASSPIQYKSVLICCLSDSVESPDANRYWSNRFLHRCHWSGTLNRNGAGGSNRIFSAAIQSLNRVALLTPCNIV